MFVSRQTVYCTGLYGGNRQTNTLWFLLETGLPDRSKYTILGEYLGAKGQIFENLAIKVVCYVLQMIK